MKKFIVKEFGRGRRSASKHLNGLRPKCETLLLKFLESMGSDMNRLD